MQELADRLTDLRKEWEIDGILRSDVALLLLFDDLVETLFPEQREAILGAELVAVVKEWKDTRVQLVEKAETAAIPLAELAAMPA